MLCSMLPPEAPSPRPDPAETLSSAPQPLRTPLRFLPLRLCLHT